MSQPNRTRRDGGAQNGGVTNSAEAPDPYLWLEDITGDDALAWVREHNEPTLAELGGDRFEQMRAEALEVLDTDTRIPVRPPPR